MIYPVGSVVFRYDEQSPEDFLGGVWEEISTKKLKIVTHNLDYSDKSATDIGTPTVTLTTDQIPSHNHSSETGSSTGHYATDFSRVRYLMSDTDSKDYTNKTYSTGEDNPHNNIPAYIVVRAWKRTE